MPRIADCGWLMIGVPNCSPKMPELVSVNVPPEISSGASFLRARAVGDRSTMARAMPRKFFSSVCLMTGTIRPQSSATAMPMLMFLL
jgi:hypothetical protein